MNHAQFRRAYRAARTGQINSDTLEGVVAIIAFQDARKPDLIGEVFRDARDFEDFISERHEKAERLNDLRSRRRAKMGDYKVELPEEVCQPVDFDYC